MKHRILGGLVVFMLGSTLVQADSDSLATQAISAGQKYGLALRSDGTVWSWGTNRVGELGQGTNSLVLSPRRISSLSNLLAIAAGPQHALAVGSNGTVWAWGMNSDGRLGNGTSVNTSNPVVVSTITNAITVAAGATHSLAALSDGRVMAWGANNAGQLGTGNTISTNKPVVVDSFTNVIAVAAGTNYSLALTASGDVWAWGTNNLGQLGLGNNTSQTTPVRITTLSNIVQIAAGHSHALARNRAGQIIVWGRNTEGQLGDGTTNNSNTPTPVASFGSTNTYGAARWIAANFNSASAVGTSGRLFYWGAYGNGTTNSTTTQVIELGANSGNEFQNVTYGDSYLLAGQRDGSVWAWGFNLNGEWGNGAVRTATDTWRYESVNPVFSFSAQPKAQVTRYMRGDRENIPYTSFVLPLDMEEGVQLDAEGSDQFCYGTGAPWFMRVKKTVRQQAWKRIGATTNLTRFNVENPVVAFGSDAGGSPLYTGKPYTFGAYGGAFDEKTSQTNMIRILVYDRAALSSGATNVQPTNTITFALPRRFIAADSNAWSNFITNNSRVVIETNGLRTAVEFADALLPDPVFAQNIYNNWGLGWQFAFAQNVVMGGYRITHQATSTNYCYVVEVMGSVEVGANVMAPMTVTNTTGWSHLPLYALGFEAFPEWRSHFVDTPHFEGIALPPAYTGRRPAELAGLTAEATNVVWLTNNAAYTNLDATPELRRHPKLDQLVEDLGRNPLALAAYVVNEIELTDPLATYESSKVVQDSVELGGVNRSALATYLEGQGSPAEQCALLVYLLRQAGYPAGYVFPTNNNLRLLDTTLSRLWQINVKGVQFFAGVPVITNSLIAVNYPWVVANIGTNVVHIFPWMKNTEIVEGDEIYDFMPTNYPSAYPWIKDYALAKPEIMALGDFKDTATTFWRNYLTGVLNTNQSQPNLSLDRFGVRAFNRRLAVNTWNDLPKPNFLTNQTLVAVVPTLTENPATYPFLTNLFDRVRIEVFKDNTNSANKLFDTGLWRASDLHNRKLLLYTNTATTLALWLAPYRDGLTNNSAFTNFEAGTASLNLQMVQTNVASTVTNLPVRVTYQRRAGTYASAGSWYPLQEWTPIPFTFTAEKRAVTAIYPSFGRVTPAMQQAHAEDYWKLQQQRASDPNFTPATTDDAGTTATLLASSYFEKLWTDDQLNQSLHKVKGLFWNSWGVIGLTKRTNGTMIIKLDMVWTPNLLLGNARLRQDSTDRGQLSLDNYRMMNLAIGASAEHAVIGDMFGDSTAISSVRLLQIAAERSRSNGLAMPPELNVKNYAGIGNQTNTGYGSTLLKNQDAGIWSSITNTYTTSWDSNYVRVLITPGAVSNATGKFKGMAAMTFGRWTGGAMLGVNSNVLNGGFYAESYWVGAPSFSSYQLTYNLSYSPAFGYSFVYNNFTLPQPHFDFSPNEYVTLGTTNGVGLIAFTPQQMTQASVAAADMNVNTGTAAGNLKVIKDAGWHGRTSGGVQQTGSTMGDPVHVVSGDFYSDATDLALAGSFPLELRRNYFSRSLADNQLGQGWKLSFAPWLVLSTNASGVSIIQAAEPDGAVIAYRYQTNNVWIVTPEDNPTLVNFTRNGIGSTANPFNNRIELSTNSGSLYTLSCPNGDRRSYLVMTNFGLASGTNYLNRVRPYLTQWVDHAGNYYTFSYGTNSAANDFGQVNKIEGVNGAFLVLKYDVNARLIEAFTSDNRRVRYAYDSFGDLVKVTLPDDSSWQYEYEHYTFTTNSTLYTDSNHLLVKETKPDGRVLLNNYDSLRRVTSQAATVGVNRELVTNAWFYYTNNAASLTNDLLTGVTRVEDVFHNPYLYSYTNSLITRIVEPLGRTNIQDWFESAETNKAGYYPRSIELTVDIRGLTNEFRYSSSGNPTNLIVRGDLTGSGTSGQSATNVFSFTTNNLLSTVSTPTGNGVALLYEDGADVWRPTSVVRIGGGVPIATNRFYYTNATTTVDMGGWFKTNQAFGLLARAVRADSATNDWSYDGRGFVTQSIQYARTADFASNTDPAVTNYFTFTDQGDLAEQVDALGRRARMGHDAMGRRLWRDVLDETGTALARENFHYNRNGELEWYDGPRSNPDDFIHFDYDGAGRLVEELQWRSRARTDGSGVEAESGDDLYATTFHRYDAFGNLLATIRPNRAVTTNIWDALGRLSGQKVLDASGTLLTSQGFTYEPGGQVTFSTNALQGVTERRYTSTGQLKYQKNADGSTNGWVYYLDGRLATNFLSNGAFWWTQYDDANRTVTRTFCSPAGTPLATNVSRFDLRGNAVTVTDAGGNTFTNTFDGLDRLKATVGPAITTIVEIGQFPGSGEYATNTFQPSFTNYFDAAGAVFTSANALGEKAISWFDALGRNTRLETRSTNGTLVRESSASFAPDFNSVTLTEGSGASAISTTFYTDTDGQVVLQAANSSTDVTESLWNRYNNMGSLVESRRYATTSGSQTLFSSQTRTHDGLQRVLTATAGDGAVTSFAYDSAGNVTNRTMPGGLQWRAVYSSAGQLLEERNIGSGDVATRTNSYTYFSAGSPFAGLPQTRTDGRGVTSTFSYDDWLRPATNVQSGPLDEHDVTTVWQYEVRGFLTNAAQSFANSAIGPATAIQRRFDQYGQLSSEAVMVGTSNLYSAGLGWDVAGRRTGLGLGNGYNFTWQADGLLKSASFGSLGSGNYAYNTAGLLTSRSVGSRVTSINSRDGVGRPLSITTTVNTLTKLTETLSWTGDGLPSSHTLAREDFTDSRQFSYANQTRRLTEERLNLDASKRWTNSYTFDNGASAGPGVLTQIGTPASGAATWSGVTDAFSRIGTETNSAARQLAFGRVNGTATITAALDGVPQSVNVINTADTTWSKQWNATLDLTPGAHQLAVSAAHPSGLFTTNATSLFTNNIGSQAVTDTHDAAGNLTQRIWRKPNGTTSLMQTLSWDGAGRLYKVVERDGNNSGRDFTVVYDAFGRRLQTSEITVTNGVTLTNQPLVISHYFDPLVEFLEMGVTENGNTTWKLIGPDFDGTYGGQNGTGGFEAEATALTFAPVVSDAFGNVLARQEQTGLAWHSSRLNGYGGVPGYRPLSLGSSGSLTAKYAWRNRASESVSLTWMGGNWLDSASGRFISPDPFGHDGSHSLYSFGFGSPYAFWDADGRSPGQKGLGLFDSQAGLPTFPRFPGKRGTGFPLDDFYKYAGRNPVGWDNYDKYFHSELSEATSLHPFGSIPSSLLREANKRGYVGFWDYPIGGDVDGRGVTGAMDMKTLAPMLLLSVYGEAMAAPMGAFGRSAPAFERFLVPSRVATVEAEVVSSSPRLLTQGNRTTMTLNQVRSLRGEVRWRAAERYVQELYGSQGQRHFSVPTTGGRFVDAPADIKEGVLANEVKMYQSWRTVQGTPQAQTVPLSDDIRNQILKEVWLRRNVPNYQPRWLFLDAPPSQELERFLLERRIISIWYN